MSANRTARSWEAQIPIIGQGAIKNDSSKTLAQMADNLDNRNPGVTADHHAGRTAGRVVGEIDDQENSRPNMLGLRDGDAGLRGGLCVGAMRTSLLPSEQFQVLPSEQSKLLDSLLPSEQAETDKQQAEWLKSLLPKLSAGWWDVAANGKGFIIKQKWRERKKQITQTYPRVSREQFQTLKGSSYAKEIIRDSIVGHLDLCSTHKLKVNRERAESAAARLGAAH